MDGAKQKTRGMPLHISCPHLHAVYVCMCVCVCAAYYHVEDGNYKVLFCG